MSEAKQQELISVLAEYVDVAWDSGTSRENAIQFWIHGKRVLYQYDQANLNARSDLRQKLRDLGAVPKVTPKPPPPIIQPEIVQPEIAQPETVAPHLTSPPPIVASSPRQMQGYTIFQSTRVIGIELDRDLNIPKGNVLVIPLNRPNTFIDMTSDLFHAIFDEAVESNRPIAPETLTPRTSAPVTPAATRRTDESNDVVAFLQQRNGAVRSKVIADALDLTLKAVEAHLRRLQGNNVVMAPQPGFWTLASKASPSPRPVGPKAPAPKPPRFSTGPGRSRHGISPQVGRMLAVMAYVSKKTGKTDLTTSQVVPHLDDRDGRQFSARIPSAVDKGFAERGLPLPDGQRGWHYRLTAKGLALIKELGAWSFEHDRLSPPEWLAHI